MNTLRFQNVRAVLADLEDTADYRALKDSPDTRAQEFRQGVDMVGIRCLQWEPEPPTDREIEDYLLRLEVLCVGSLARFERFIVMARDALHAT